MKMIRKSNKIDNDELTILVNKIDIFTDEEKKCAVELIEESNIEKDEYDYNTFLYEDDKVIKGYYCLGKRQLTEGVFDLYWIVIDPDFQSEGIGSKLIKHAINFAYEHNARWLLAETSSLDDYIPTRKFYIKHDFYVLTEIPDFYKVNDSLILFGKSIKI